MGFLSGHSFIRSFVGNVEGGEGVKKSRTREERRQERYRTPLPLLSIPIDGPRSE